MIDEPELSMHPKWQEKILNYYKNLYVVKGIQKVQMFFATHSEYVIREALINQDKNLVIVLKDDNGTINSKRIDSPFVLPTITVAETNYYAFDILSNDYHIELYGYLQSKKSCNKVKQCDDYIKGQSKYNKTIHEKKSSHGSTSYFTLPTYIRNAIDHPDSGNTFTSQELRISIELLIELCK